MSEEEESVLLFKKIADFILWSVKCQIVKETKRGHRYEWKVKLENEKKERIFDVSTNKWKWYKMKRNAFSYIH